MALGHYTRPARIQADSLDVRTVVGRPLLVKVREFRPDFTSPKFPNPKDVVIVDVVDLLGPNNDGNAKIFVGPLWGAAAVVDGLKENAGRDITLPVMPVNQQSGSGRTYVTLIPLEDKYLAFAEAWYAKNANAIDEARNAKEAQANPLGQITPAEAPPAPSMQQGVPLPQAGFKPAPVEEFQAPDKNGTEAPPFPAPQATGPATEDNITAALARLNG